MVLAAPVSLVLELFLILDNLYAARVFSVLAEELKSRSEERRVGKECRL